MPELFEFEEPELVEASHLMRTHCHKCGAGALAVPEMARRARCGGCLLADSGAGCGETVPVTPVVRQGVQPYTYNLGTPLPGEVLHAAYPAPTYVGPAVQIIGDEPEFDGVVPAPVMTLAEYAREASWEVWLQYSRGRFPHGTTGRPGAEKHVIGMRFGAHPMTGRQAYAVYSCAVSGGAWTWGSIAVWGPDLPPYLGCGVTELRAYLGEYAAGVDTEVIKLWIDDLRSIAENGVAQRKAREAERKEIRAKHAEGVSLAKLSGQYGRDVAEIEKIVSAKRSSGKRKESGG